jgi:hypothetical protein
MAFAMRQQLPGQRLDVLVQTVMYRYDTHRLLVMQLALLRMLSMKTSGSRQRAEKCTEPGANAMIAPHQWLWCECLNN